MPFGSLRDGHGAGAGRAPALLLLDEPAAGINDSETEQLPELILQIARARRRVCLSATI